METAVKVLLEEKGHDVTAVASTTTVSETVQLMNKKNIGAVLVIDDNKLVGIFTERDVLRRVVEGCADFKTTPISEVMTRELIHISPSTTVKEVLMIITKKYCRHLPVLDDNNNLAGLISSGDISRFLVKDQQHHIDELVNYISGTY